MATRIFNAEFIREDVLEREDTQHIESDTSYRHGSYETYVFFEDNKHWMFTVPHHTHEGLEFYDTVECDEVEPVQVTTIDWKLVK